MKNLVVFVFFVAFLLVGCQKGEEENLAPIEKDEFGIEEYEKEAQAIFEEFEKEEPLITESHRKYPDAVSYNDAEIEKELAKRNTPITLKDVVSFLSQYEMEVEKIHLWDNLYQYYYGDSNIDFYAFGNSDTLKYIRLHRKNVDYEKPREFEDICLMYFIFLETLLPEWEEPSKWFLGNYLEGSARTYIEHKGEYVWVNLYVSSPSEYGSKFNYIGISIESAE